MTSAPSANRLGPRAQGSAEMLLRRGLLLVAATTAFGGIFGGLARMDIVVAWGPRYFSAHGPLLVLGVFTTVIGLERAVALGRAWGLVAPGLGATAAVAMLTGFAWAPWIGVGSGLALVALNAAIVRRQAAPFTYLMLLGSAVLLLGAALWALGRPVFEIVPTWIAFFVLTIAAERLELSRLAPTPQWASRTLVLLACFLASSSCASALGWGPALRVFGIAIGLLGAWELQFDLARRTVNRPGLPRFAALGVLLGAGWLLVTGVLLISIGLPPAGPGYDAPLHGVFVGYVLSMVFAHAPIILPAVARVELPFSKVLYVPLAVLHLGLGIRIAGDLAGHVPLRQVGGIANAVALALFALSVFYARTVRPAAKSG